VQLLQAASIEQTEPCPYLPGRQKRYESFYAIDLDAAELAGFLADGWRKFGPYFFRPACDGCRSCIPLRVCVDAFVPSRSQRRTLRQNRELNVQFTPLQPSTQIYDLYARHATTRFGTVADVDQFACLFYLPSCPTLQTELRLGEELVGVGWLDCAGDGLSSVYFCFDPQHATRRLGALSILHEIALCKERGLPWYYLGYYVPGCPVMAYKDQYLPRQHFDWEDRIWRDIL
jgi:arginine-tRNA-protein transferase